MSNLGITKHHAKVFFTNWNWLDVKRINSWTPHLIASITDRRLMPKPVRYELQRIDARRNSQPQAYQMNMFEDTVWAVYNADNAKNRATVNIFGPKGERFGSIVEQSVLNRWEMQLYNMLTDVEEEVHEAV